MSARVFIIGTGRCGSSTCYQACRHAVNYLARHEELRLQNIHEDPAADRPVIDIGAQAIGCLAYLKNRFPQARWIHLRRNREECIHSLASQCTEAIRHYAQLWFFQADAPPLQIAELFYDACYHRIRTVLPDAYELHLETAYEQWSECWQLMNCQGDLAASRQEWLRRYNPAILRGRDNFVVS